MSPGCSSFIYESISSLGLVAFATSVNYFNSSTSGFGSSLGSIGSSSFGASSMAEGSSGFPETSFILGAAEKKPS